MSDSEEYSSSGEAYSDSEGATDSAYYDASDYTGESDDEDSEIYEPIEDLPEGFQSEDEDSLTEGSEDGEEPETPVLPEGGSLPRVEDWGLKMQNEAVCYQRHDTYRIEDSQRISEPALTVYEMVKIIGTRETQLSLGAPPLIGGVEDLTNAQIAYAELLAGRTPYRIHRFMPGGGYEEWKISELEIIHTWSDPRYVVPGSVQVGKGTSGGEEATAKRQRGGKKKK